MHTIPITQTTLVRYAARYPQALARIFVFLLCLNPGCLTDNQRNSVGSGNDSSVTETCSKPTQLAVIADKTRSLEMYGVPSININHVIKFIEVLDACGGEIGFTTIQEDSTTPILRLYLPPKPVKPSLTTFLDPFSFRNALNAWKEEIRKRDIRINHFLQHAKHLLDKSEVALHSDVHGNLYRIYSFLNEARMWQQKPTQTLVIVSDLQHTATAEISLPAPPHNVRLILVRGSRQHIPAFPPKTKLLVFESPDSVVRHLIL